MQSWRERCEKCVCLQGDYVEKWLHFQLPVVSSLFKINNKLGDLRTWTPHVYMYNIHNYIRWKMMASVWQVKAVVSKDFVPYTLSWQVKFGCTFKNLKPQQHWPTKLLSHVTASQTLYRLEKLHLPLRNNYHSNNREAWGTRWRSWLRHCGTSRKVAGSIPGGVIGVFHWHNPSGRTMALGSTQPRTEMSTRNISWG